MPGAQLATQPSPQDLVRLQEEAGVEFVNGQILEKPVSIGSNKVEAEIIHLLKTETSQSKSAEVFASGMGYRCFADDPLKFRKPDVSLVRSERLKGHDDDEGFITFAPDLAVEVVSPNDLAEELQDKVQEYLTNGFPLVWVVHPSSKTVTIYRRDRSQITLGQNDEITGESALPSFRCKVAQFFPEPLK